MLIKLENGVIINTNQIVVIFGGCAYMTAVHNGENYICVTDKDIENIMISQQQFFVLPDYKIEAMGGIFTGSNK